MADARDRDSCRDVLVELVTHVIRSRSPAMTG
jgi:hypothetical protein